MKTINFKIAAMVIALGATTVSCDKDNDMVIDNTPDFSGTFQQADQMGRPAVNTVFVSSLKQTILFIIPVMCLCLTQSPSLNLGSSGLIR
jgi:hypothetical protein